MVYALQGSLFIHKKLAFGSTIYITSLDVPFLDYHEFEKCNTKRSSLEINSRSGYTLSNKLSLGLS